MPRLLVVAAVALAALVSGCGGADVAYTEVTSDPATLPIPDGATATGAAGTQTTTGPSGRVRERSTPDPDDTTSTDTTTVPPVITEVPPTTADPVVTDPVVPEDTTDDDTGAAAPPTTEDLPEEPVDDTGGATAPTDQFCADNPGACSN